MDAADHIFRAEVEAMLTREQLETWPDGRHADVLVRQRPQPGLVSDAASEMPAWAKTVYAVESPQTQ